MIHIPEDATNAWRDMYFAERAEKARLQKGLDALLNINEWRRDEITELRRALIDALIEFDIGEDTQFHKKYAELIAGAEKEINSPTTDQE